MRRLARVLLLGATCTWAAHAAPAPEVSAAAPRPASVQESVLDLLRKRTVPRKPPQPARFRFGRLGNPEWPDIRVSEVRRGESGLKVLFAGDKEAYAEGGRVKALDVQIIRIRDETVTLELRQERRDFPVPLRFPALELRAIEALHGAWVAYFVGDRRPHYEGDEVLGARLRKIVERAVTLEFRGTQKTLALAPVKPTFPVVTYRGCMGVGRTRSGIFLLDGGKQELKSVGDSISGARIVEVLDDRVVLRFGDEVRTVYRAGTLRLEKPGR